MIRRLTCALIMPVHGPLADAGPALGALSFLSPTPEQILIVRDQSAAGDDLLLPAGACFIEVPYATGAARARNAGAAAATTELFLFVDADVVIPPNTIQRVRDEFASYPHIAAIFGSYDTSPGHPGFLSQYRNLMHHYVHQLSCEDAGTFWSGLGVVRAAAFRLVGGFNSKRFAIEDIEFGYRMMDSGQKIRLAKDLQGSHYKHWTPAGMLWTDLFVRGVPWVRLILERGKMPTDLNTTMASRWSTVLVYFSLLLLLWLPWTGLTIAVGIFCIGGVLLLNLPFYRFLAHQRGCWFALFSLPWHFLHYLLCGAAVIIGIPLHGSNRLRRSFFSKT